MKKYICLVGIGITMLASVLSAQDCSIVSKANDITPDRLCSPVTVNWDVSIAGVNDGGKPVQIMYDWDDGTVEIFDAVNIDPSPAVREWGYTASHAYTSTGNKCNYHPKATLIVDGQVCTSSSQEQIVTVWDVDDRNGGELQINPDIYPICVGNSANARFRDVTLFNCVPPQENDVPNLSTRWIQWVYGTDITMTGAPVTINGNPQAFPYYGPITTLPGPVTGSGIYSDIMNVANDKSIGQYFEVTLRYWNYCNPYDDPLIPGPPADPLNGDNPPVTTTAIILIVPFPDATIDQVAPVCLSASPFKLSAVDGGGKWTGDGITNENTGRFNPALAGTGDHIIRYEITDGNSCSDWDTTIISVMPAPAADIVPQAPLCTYNSPVKLNSVVSSGTWTGTGISNPSTGIFDPSVSGPGMHDIIFESAPDIHGCVGRDTTQIQVDSPPDAYFLTDDTSWCEAASDSSFALIKIDGTNDLDYDLIWDMNGIRDTISGISNDTVRALLQNNPGMNEYELYKVIENFGNNSCESTPDDELKINIIPAPDAKMQLHPDGFCSPVTTTINSTNGSNYTYNWFFGDGSNYMGDSSFVAHTFYNEGTRDTSYRVMLIISSPGGCVDSVTESIPVYPNPRADFFVTPIIQDYPATDVMISNFSKPGNWKYAWNFGDGSISSQKEPGNHSYSTYGEYPIRLISYSIHCSDTMSRMVRILPPPPQAGFNPDTSGCSPLTVKFNNTSRYGENYFWDFDDGTYATEKNPEHTFYQSKDYQVKLVVSGIKGNSEAKHTVRVYPVPVAEFNAYPDSATRTDQVFKFYNNSDNAGHFLWDFGDGSISHEENPSYVYNSEGTFDVSLYIESPEGCLDTLVQERFIKIAGGEGDIAFPNVFRWNGSGPTGGYWTPGELDNTVFHPHFENVEEYKLLIYSRWGELLYTSDDLYKGWDGYLKDGTRAPQGVYVYKAWVKYVDGTREVRAGDVTFLY